MKILKTILSIGLISCFVIFSTIDVQAKGIKYQFRFLTQGANAYAPAKAKKIQLRFKNAPKTTLYATTDSQGKAVFISSRCKEDDPAELIFKSDFPDHQMFRVPVSISCGTEDSTARSYSFGIFSLTYGKLLASNLDGLDGPCYLCKAE